MFHRGSKETPSNGVEVRERKPYSIRWVIDSEANHIATISPNTSFWNRPGAYSVFDKVFAPALQELDESGWAIRQILPVLTEGAGGYGSWLEQVAVIVDKKPGNPLK